MTTYPVVVHVGRSKPLFRNILNEKFLPSELLGGSRLELLVRKVLNEKGRGWKSSRLEGKL